MKKDEFRKLAEKKIPDLPENIDIEALTPEQIKNTLHELSVHQIELEMQNEELKRTYLELESVKSRYFDLYDLAPVGYCTVSDKGIIKEANLALSNLLCELRGVLVKQPFSRYILNEDQDKYYIFLKKLISEKKTESNSCGLNSSDSESILECELRMLSNNKIIFWVNLGGVAALDSDGLQVYRIVLRNITAQKQAEMNLLNLMEETELLRIKEKEANEAKSLFLASMSHEIRTPLNAIIGMTDLALMTSDEKELHDYLDIVKNSGNHLLHVISDILDFSKIESGNLLLEEKEFHLKNIFFAVEQINKFELAKKGLSFNCKISDDLPARIIADELRLRQILLNLVSNALKFTESGNIEIRATLKRDIEIKPGFSAIEISISDTGCGIPLDKQNIIFSKFQQSDMSTSRKYGGTGLGLSIVKELVKLMGGDIIVKSEPGAGSEFILWVIAKNSDSIQCTEKKAVLLDENFIGRNILLAEDNETNILLTKTVLKKLGNAVTVARNGIEALDYLNKNNFDLIFMDIEMPEMDGFEATRRIRAGECGSGKSAIPIIAMTAHAVTGIKHKALDAGMNDFITKPIDVTKLKERIDAIFKE